MVRFSPVTYAANGEHSAVAHQAISSIVASRPAGTVRATRASSSGVGHSAAPAPSVAVGPGQIVFTRIPWDAHSTASVRVIATSPALAAAECTVPGPPVHA